MLTSNVINTIADIFTDISGKQYSRSDNQYALFLDLAEPAFLVVADHDLHLVFRVCHEWPTVRVAQISVIHQAPGNLPNRRQLQSQLARLLITEQGYPMTCSSTLLNGQAHRRHA